MQGGLHLPLLLKRALDTIGRLPSPAHGRAGWAVGAERRETNPHGVGVRAVPPPHSVVYNENDAMRRIYSWTVARVSRAHLTVAGIEGV